MKNLLHSSAITLLGAVALMFITPKTYADQPLSLADSLALPTGKTDWVDPVSATPPGAHYILYPTPQRGEGTVGSCMVYLPEAYTAHPDRRYPVIYYLHGGTGNQREARWMIERLDSAINSGKMQPVIVVSPQALPIGWYVNANTSDPKVTSGPIHDVLLHDLIPYIDTHYLTVDSTAGRGIEGFSMGGRGAMMMGLRYPELFGAVSSVAGALVNWDEEPLQRSLECTFGDINNPDSRIYFDAWHPRNFACLNARTIKTSGMKIRMFVGDQDRLFEENGTHITTRFHNLLDTLGIQHTFEIVPGANHNPAEIFAPGVKEYDVTFWDKALSSSTNNIPGPEEIPDTLKTFVNDNFPGRTVLSLTKLPDDRGTHYQLLLSDATLLKFNEHFKWILADRTASTHSTPFPDSLTHEGIASYISANYPGATILRIAKVPHTGYDVLLSDATTLLFDPSGRNIPR